MRSVPPPTESIGTRSASSKRRAIPVGTPRATSARARWKLCRRARGIPRGVVTVGRSYALVGPAGNPDPNVVSTMGDATRNGFRRFRNVLVLRGTPGAAQARRDGQTSNGAKGLQDLRLNEIVALGSGLHGPLTPLDLANKDPEVTEVTCAKGPTQPPGTGASDRERPSARARPRPRTSGQILRQGP